MLGEHLHLVLVTLHLDDASRCIAVGGNDAVSLSSNAKRALHRKGPV